MDTDGTYNVHLQIPLHIAVHTLVRDQRSSLLWMKLAALDQRLHSSHVLIPPLTTVHILKILVFSVCHVSVLLVFSKKIFPCFSFFLSLYFFSLPPSLLCYVYMHFPVQVAHMAQSDLLVGHIPLKEE